MGLVSSEDEEAKDLSLSPCAQSSHVRTQPKQVPPGTKLAGTLILDLEPPKL